MGFWSRHKRKILVTVGALGCGYALYKIYDVHKRKSIELDNESEAKRRADELVRIQLQIHFENIQRISETTTLPHAMAFLRSRISEELDISHLTEKLMQVKGQVSSLQPNEKLDLWNRLKILSFTRTVTSLWAMIVLFLYVRVQVNILGRQLYLEAARGFATPSGLDEVNPFDKYGQHEFLATADYLSEHGIGSLILNMENATLEVLRDKQLRDPFSLTRLSQIVTEILELFMNSGSPGSWVSYVVPESAAAYQQLSAMSSNVFENHNILMDTSKLEQLIVEARAVLSSTEFRNIVEATMRTVVDGLMEDLSVELNDPTAVYPLVKLLPQVARLGPAVLEEASSNRYITRIRGLPEVELFYTLIYTNTSQATPLYTNP